MATEIIGRPITRIYGEQVSLTTTAAHLAFMPNFKEILFYCPSAWRLGIAPRLKHCVLYDGSDYTDYINSVTDRSSATHMPLDGMTTSKYVYLGFVSPSRGVYFDLDTSHKNAETATLDVEYCSTAVANGATIAFTDVAGDSDGTDSPGATLSKDGLYAWTVPSAWVESTLGTFASPLFSKCYWIRFKPSATLSSEIDVIEVIPAAYDTNYGFMEAAMSYQFALNTDKNGAFEFDHTSTDTLDVNWITH